MSLIRKLGLWRDERGITGLETAIVLIAFVVVASVFAFAVLSTGLLSSEKATATVLGGLEETSATLVLRGGVIAHASSTLTEIDYVTFQVNNATLSGEAVSLAEADLIVTYIDSSQSVNIGYVPNASSTQGWTATWLAGTGPLVNPGERVEVIVGLHSLTNRLGVDTTEFTIEVKPATGASMVVQRTLPAELTLVTNLQ